MLKRGGMTTLVIFVLGFASTSSSHLNAQATKAEGERPRKNCTRTCLVALRTHRYLDSFS